MVGTWKCTAICLLLGIVVAAGVSISNGLVEVGFTPSKELSYFTDLALGKTVHVYDSKFRMVVNGTVYHQTDLQLMSVSNSPTYVKTTYQTNTNAPAQFQVDVTYEVKEGWNFFSKKLDVTPAKEALWIDAILPYCTLEVDASSANQVVPATFQDGGCVDYAALVRYSDNTGFFLALQNPFTGYTIDAPQGQNTVVNSSFAVGMVALPGTTFNVDAALIGTYQLSPYYPFGQDYVNPAERDAISNCVDQFVKDLFPSNGVIKVNVAWDENDFQLDVNTQHGVESYERIIDQNAVFGITHVIYAPRNSAISSRRNATDSWGWEEGLWLGLGEHIRENRWDPNTDPLPPTVSKMLDYAASRNVKLMAYVYPILAFSQNPSWLFTSGSSTFASLASLEFQAWLSDTLITFAKKANLGGYAFDYTFFNDPRNTIYAQWKGWMTIRANLKNALPDLIIDNRQLDHEYGAWNTLSGSYAEPLMSDENPETYGIQLIPDLHTDRCAANFLRIANFNYRSKEFVPSSRVPGFMFHQTDREYLNGSLAWDDWFIRDFDYLGFKYSLMSNLATAGLNFVACMIPARDIAEFKLFPPEEAQFIRNWFQFAEDNVKYLSNTVPIISAPSLGMVDGTSSIYNNEGFLFLFNPNMLQKNVTIKFDQSINLVPPKGKEQYLVSMMYPEKQNMVIVGFGDSWTMSMDGTSAVALQMQKMTSSIKSPLLFGVSGTVGVSGKVVSITSAMGEAGKPITITVMLPKSADIDQVLINNRPVNFTQDPSKIALYINGAFAGEYFPRAKQIDVYNPSFTGGVVTANFSVPSSVFDQLHARAVKYPIPWDPIDADATWLIPTRLLIYIQIVDPSDQWNVQLELNGVSYPLSKAYNSRRVVNYCFTGFYLDATNLIKPDTQYQLRVTLPTLNKGQLQGIFFENIETIYTDQFISSK